MEKEASEIAKSGETVRIRTEKNRFPNLFKTKAADFCAMQKSAVFSLVEMMGIEPMSENPSTKLSSWTVCYLKFPSETANRHAVSSGSPFMLDRFKSEPPMQVHCSDDVQSEAAVLIGGTGGPQATALPGFTQKRKTQAAIATLVLSFII